MSVTPIERKGKAFEYTQLAQGPHVGKRCIDPGCKTYARWVITPLGADPATGEGLCGKHLTLYLASMMLGSGTAYVIQEIPRVARTRVRPRRAAEGGDA